MKRAAIQRLVPYEGVRPEDFLFASVPVVSCRCSPAGRGAVCRDHPRAGTA